MPKAKPYGSWPSPITADLVATQGTRISEPRYADDGLYWIESRPDEGGRSVLVKRNADNTIEDVTPPPFSVRSRVHEYGGGAVAIGNGIVYFVNGSDQRVYRHAVGEKPVPLTPDNGCRYADLEYDSARHRLLAVVEFHRPTVRQTINALVFIDCKTGRIVALSTRADFYSTPRLNPDCTQMAWLRWNHPNMPWDGTELWLAEIDKKGMLANPRCVAGGAEESIFQPAFSPNGILHFVSDRTDWWNLYRLNGDTAEPIAAKSAEFGRPQWQFNMRTYGFADADTVIACYTQDGIWHVAEIDHKNHFRTLRLPYTVIEHIDAANGQAVLLAASPEMATSVVELDCLTGIPTPVRGGAGATEFKNYLSIARPLSYTTRDGATAYALYYAPCNHDCKPKRKTLPPLLVKCHGGPTAAVDAALDLRIQYWTSRGFAVLDVNYRGSTGYGRPYRQQLYGQWGIVDVTDCIDGALHLVEEGKVDPDRLAIYGSSAGGYTVLAALTFHDVFAVGASLYGISDLKTVMADTHKFESRYGDQLLGPWPEAEAIYNARSPGRHAAHLNCPMIFFQGLKDKVVPPSQTERMVRSLTTRGVPVAAVTFPDEAHGFRSAEAIRTTLESQLAFFGRALGFEPADKLPEVQIRNEENLETEPA